MKKMIILSFIAIAITNFESNAQSKGRDYTTALGVKFYPGAGVTLKHFIKKDAALEGIGNFWKDGMRITGLYEFHGDISGAAGLKWYAGGGAHVGFFNSNYWRREYGITRTNGVAGIDGVVGLDYKINGAPLNLSLDWQPSFEFGTYGGFIGNWGGFALRYTF